MEGVDGVTRKGWFKWDGVQDGDRTAEEQLRGLEAALAVCKGKTVLDLGCAEGFIAAAFAKAGASRVVGIELLADHVAVGRKVCAGLPVDLIVNELAAWIAGHPDPEQFDIVLALGIAHKILYPGTVIEFAAKSAKELVVFRGPGKKGMFWDGTLRAKFGGATCHVPSIFKKHGFTEGETHDSAQGERAQYWHKQ